MPATGQPSHKIYLSGEWRSTGHELYVRALIDESFLAAALNQIDDAQQRGATIQLGGHRHTESTGYFLEPTVLDPVSPDSLCMYEETSAFIAQFPVCSFNSEEKAITLANQSQFGLSAYVMSRDAARIFRCAETIEAGTIPSAACKSVNGKSRRRDES